MRKILMGLGLVLMVSTLTPAGASAQIDPGFYVGFSQTDWDYEPAWVSSDLFDSKNGFQVGVFLEGELNGRLGIRTELAYARKGSKSEFDMVSEEGANLGQGTVFWNADYFQLPVMLSLDLAPNAKIHPMVMAGPYVAWKVSSKSTVDGIPEDPDLTDEDREVDVDDSDVGFILGVGVATDLGGQEIQLLVRYEAGLSEVYLESKNQVLTALVGVTF